MADSVDAGGTQSKDQQSGSQRTGDDNRNNMFNDSTNAIDQKLFVANVEALVDDPCRYWKPGDAEKIGEAFADDHDLSEYKELFILAARTLDDDQPLESFLAPDSDDMRALMNIDKTGYWQQSESFRADITTLCCAAILQGWTESALNGANLTWPNALLEQLQSCSPIGRKAWIFASVNASTYFAASLIGCWFSDPLSETSLGRRWPICISAVVILMSAVGGAASQTWKQYLVFRVFLGIGMGCKATVVPVFLAEIATAASRGSLVMNWQLFVALGITLGFASNLALSFLGRHAWRAQTLSCALPTLIVLARIFVAPDSPRFLMKRGNYRAAFQSLVRLRTRSLLAARELLHIHLQMKVEDMAWSRTGKPDAESQQPRSGQAVGSRFWSGRFLPVFTVPRNRRALTAAVVCMTSQQLCGVNVLIFYSSTFFCSNVPTGYSGNTLDAANFLDPMALSLGLGAVNFLLTFPAYRLIDRCGRRWLLLIALPSMAASMMAAALSSRHAHLKSSQHEVIGFTFVFIFFYSWSMGPVPFTYAAEVFPLDNRMTGMSAAVFTNFLGAGLVTMFVPILTEALGHDGLLAVFAGLNVTAFILVFFLVPETAPAAVERKEGSLHSIQLEQLIYIFGVESAVHARYQITQVPLFLKKYLFWLVKYAWRAVWNEDENVERLPKPRLPALYKWKVLREKEIERRATEAEKETPEVQTENVERQPT